MQSIDFRIDEFVRELTGREKSLFADDLSANQDELTAAIEGRSVLVLGGAGTIGSAFAKEVLRYRPSRMLVVDTNENGLAELIRDLRSDAHLTLPQELTTFPMDFADPIAQQLIDDEGPFDIVANFAALKHVRSEKNAHCSAYMIKNNVLKARQLLQLLEKKPPSHFFCVSTDKAAAPVNLMGASKKLMEEVAISFASRLPVTTARFANVAFSNGSLLDGFMHRIRKRQPLAAPSDVRRYFVSPEESGQLCLIACVLGRSGDILVPKLDAERDTKTFSEIAVHLLAELGFETLECRTEQDARQAVTSELDGQYPCYFFESDTTGEKPCEQFFTPDEDVDQSRFQGLAVVRYQNPVNADALNSLLDNLDRTFAGQDYSKQSLVDMITSYIDTFTHAETNKYLDQRM